jgi:hypothetical protein
MYKVNIDDEGWMEFSFRQFPEIRPILVDVVKASNRLVELRKVGGEDTVKQAQLFRQLLIELKGPPALSESALIQWVEAIWKRGGELQKKTEELRNSVASTESTPSS